MEMEEVEEGIEWQRTKKKGERKKMKKNEKVE
jgi:hypothetical protein